MPTTKKLLSITNLKKYFPVAKSSIFQKNRLYVRANENITIDIYEGETLGIVGESGCGKSTLGRVLLQLYPQTAGCTLYYGVTLDELTPNYVRDTIKNEKKYRKRLDKASQKARDLEQKVAAAGGEDGAAMPENYPQVKAAVLALRPVQELPREVSCLCHIDAVPDNFLLQEGGRIYLLDWEYASASVPLMDVAMFAIYAGYDREETNALLATYLGRAAQCRERARCYAYMAAGGLLWSNWCVYKEQLGETFGSYAARQYAYARLCPAWVREEETSCSQ